MRDASFFTRPVYDWQRRYEALRASFVERLPADVVADRFGYSTSYISLLRHQFKYGKIDFAEPIAEGKTRRRKVTSEVRRKIVTWRKKMLSAGEIAELLHEDGTEISVTTVERVLAEEGFEKLPRRTRIKIGLTVKGAEIPDRAERVTLAQLDGKTFESTSAGIYLFAPFMAQLKIDQLAKDAQLPGTNIIPAASYLLSFLSLKLLGTERFAHVGDHGFDTPLGWFNGLSVMPKCTALSTYSYSLDEKHLQKLQKSFVKNAAKRGLYDGKIINLDFHTVSHFGEESVLQEHWAGARNQRMKGALTLLGQDSESKLILYTDADIQRSEADEQVLEFLSFWKSIRRGINPTLVFDSRFTSYSKLSILNEQRVKFITLRRRGKKLVDEVERLADWKRIEIPHLKRKYRRPLVHESFIKLREYEGQLRQVIMKGTGHEKPTFLISNDFTMPVELLVGNYARRRRFENGIAEAVKFFHLNALSSPILTKVHLDVMATMTADTLYSMLGEKLRGFEDCDAPKLYRHFVRGKGTVAVKGDTVTVTFSRRAHNPILRRVAWNRLPNTIPGLDGAKLELVFR